MTMRVGRRLCVLSANAEGPVPEYQFEACRVLRTAGWSHFRIAAALGLSLSQVRVAVDPKAHAAHERWAA